MDERITVIIPRRSDDGHRDWLWAWLKQYWECQLPDAEFIIGQDCASAHLPFSKTQAVNEGFSRSHGDIIVILDADAFISGAVIRHCARRIRHARKAGSHIWFVPYTSMYRLTEEATRDIITEYGPCDPPIIPSPPSRCDVDDSVGSAFGRRYGAMLQIMPREAFDCVGGMDPRFRGWGGEDVSFLRAVDTLWGPHKNLPGDVLHFWHPKVHSDHRQHRGGDQWKTRVWLGQQKPRANDWLSVQYDRATRKPVQMRVLVDKGLEFYAPLNWRQKLKNWTRYLLGQIDSPDCRGQ